jgi:hypothetical protein
MIDAANSVWFTAAFGISDVLVEPIARKRDQMRFVLMEKPAPPAQKKLLTADFNRVFLSYGVPLGEIYQIKDGKVSSRRPIKEFELDKWFFKGGALSAEKRRLCFLCAHEVPPGRSAVGGSASVFRFRQFLIRLSASKR